MKNSQTPYDERRILTNLAQSLFRDYQECKKVYGEDFEARMADLAITVTELQFESTKPEGISFISAALLLLCVDDEAGDEPTPPEFHRDIRAVMAWHSMRNVDEQISTLFQ